MKRKSERKDDYEVIYHFRGGGSILYYKLHIDATLLMYISLTSIVRRE